MKHILLLVLTCSILFSCQQDYFVDNVAFTPRLVVNSLFTAGSDIDVYVHSSRNVLDNGSSIQDIDNASVLVKDENGNSVATFNYFGNGLYSSNDASLKAGESYTLEVSNEGFSSITATSTIPLQVEASVFNKNYTSTATSESLDLDLKLTDNDASDNFYVYEVGDELTLKLSKEEPFKIVDLLDVEILLTSEDINQEQVASNSLLQARVFLKDETFANSEYKINFKAKNNPAISGPVVLSAEKVFEDQKLRVVTASKNMFEYYKSIETYRIKGAANSSISEPVAVYSNVSNGLGVFAGYNDHEISLKK